MLRAAACGRAMMARWRSSRCICSRIGKAANLMLKEALSDAVPRILVLSIREAVATVLVFVNICAQAK